MEAERPVSFWKSALRFLAWALVIVLGFEAFSAINDLMTEQLLYGEGKSGAYIQLAEIVGFILALLVLLQLYGRFDSERWVVVLIILGVFVGFEYFRHQE